MPGDAAAACGPALTVPHDQLLGRRARAAGRQDFYQPVVASKQLTADELASIVANVQDLLALHERLLATLESRVATWHDRATIADIFLENVGGANERERPLRRCESVLLIRTRCVRVGPPGPERGRRGFGNFRNRAHASRAMAISLGSMPRGCST